MAKRKKDKRTNKDLQNTTHKTKDRTTRTRLKTGDEQLMCNYGTRRVTRYKIRDKS